MADKGTSPMTSKAYCSGGDFGSPSAPRLLMQVLGHRRHRKTPECEQPPWVFDAKGIPAQAEYPIKPLGDNRPKSRRPPTAPIRDDAPAMAEDGSTPHGGSRPDEDSVPLEAPSWTASSAPGPGEVVRVPNVPMGPPPTLTGKAAIPAPDPKSGLPTPAPMFSLSIRISAGVAQLWDWTLSQGYSGSFEDWVDQSIKACYRDLVGIAPMIVPVEAMV